MALVEPNRNLQVTIKIMKEKDQLVVSNCPTKELEDDKKDIIVFKSFQTPTPDDMFKFINDGNGFIEGLFRCLIREISNSKLNMVKNSCEPMDSRVKKNSFSSCSVVQRTNKNIDNEIMTRADVINMIKNLDYFIDVMVNLKSTDVKETFNIIILYERMVFDIKSEISSLKNRLKIFRTILTKR